ncbi:molybdopterin-synthase adenylyltransferase MoeB [Lysobacter silvisoli]|uniref:Molybdopterin-synthase adenylyltransferase n=1 Tax=Lysobacter silvisoli TaxID=2293254 RepID=A0A371K3Y3_9GAMM|nr:molybdopterin-synthase adenylyltransferase MoeB [Lysobacter silvisoli]
MNRERTPEFKPGPELSRDEIRHYSRHIIIPEIGSEGQRRLKAARVLLVGAGGLGSPTAQYLAASGVGTIGIVEHDTVDVSNLQRQVLYTAQDVGRPKVEAAAARLAAMNPHITIVEHRCRIEADNALALLADYDIVVDGTDNFATRYLINDACVLSGKPNVYASVFRFEGMLSVFNLGDGPCYRCLYPEPPPPGFAPSCAEGGVFGVLPGTMGLLQAVETIKLITGIGRPMAGRLLRFDATEMSFRELELRRDPGCCVCGDYPTQTGLVDYAVFCGTGLGDGAGDAEAAPIERVSAQWLQQRLGQADALQLVDVRTLNEHQIVRIDGSLLMPVDEIEEHFHTLDRNLPVVCYCKSGVRSLRAAAFLAERGFRDVASLDGGIEAWTRDIERTDAVY